MPVLQIKTNRDVLLQLNVKRLSNGNWRVSGPHASLVGTDRAATIMDVLFKHLVSRPKFRQAMRRHLHEQQ